MPEEAVTRGKVSIGAGARIDASVILGHRAEGTLTIGDNALIRSGTVIYSDVNIGKGFRTGHHVLVRENTQIGDDVLIGTNSVVDGHCRLGSNISIQTNVYVTAYTVVEDDVFMGPGSVTTNDKYMQTGAKLTGPTIKRGARIGANCTILPGVVIGEGSVVGSGSVVTKDVPPGTTVAGNPARKLGGRQ
jgi:acetyltransferase-like isoleucine patch superfamily enzyme